MMRRISRLLRYSHAHAYRMPLVAGMLYNPCKKLPSPSEPTLPFSLTASACLRAASIACNPSRFVRFFLGGWARAAGGVGAGDAVRAGPLVTELRTRSGARSTRRDDPFPRFEVTGWCGCLGPGECGALAGVEVAVCARFFSEIGLSRRGAIERDCIWAEGVASLLVQDTGPLSSWLARAAVGTSRRSTDISRGTGGAPRADVDTTVDSFLLLNLCFVPASDPERSMRHPQAQVVSSVFWRTRGRRRPGLPDSIRTLLVQPAMDASPQLLHRCLRSSSCLSCSSAALRAGRGARAAEAWRSPWKPGRAPSASPRACSSEATARTCLCRSCSSARSIRVCSRNTSEGKAIQHVQRFADSGSVRRCQ